jgi:hypothetical protein
MISVELEQRLALFYAHTDAMEDWENVLGDALVDIIWENDDKLTDDELFEYGKEVILKYLGKCRGDKLP